MAVQTPTTLSSERIRNVLPTEKLTLITAVAGVAYTLPHVVAFAVAMAVDTRNTGVLAAQTDKSFIANAETILPVAHPPPVASGRAVAFVLTSEADKTGVAIAGGSRLVVVSTR